MLIQTINPDHYAVRLAGLQDYDSFYRRELDFRRAMRYPPFSAMANLLVRSENAKVKRFYEGLGYEISDVFCMGRRIVE